MEEYVSYPILDNDGLYYNLFVKADEVAVLDLYPFKRHNALQAAKAAGVPGVRYSLDSTSKSPEPVQATSHDGNQPGPSLGAIRKRATGKYGAVWGDNTPKLLEIMSENQALFRSKRIKIEVWQHVSDKLYALNLDFSAEQVKEKMRNLKKTFAEAKQGKHGGTNWPHFKQMETIYDLPIGTSSAVPPIEAPIRVQQTAIEVPKVTAPLGSTFIISSVPADEANATWDDELPATNDFLRLSLRGNSDSNHGDVAFGEHQSDDHEFAVAEAEEPLGDLSFGQALSSTFVTSTVKQQNARQTDNSTLAIKAENLNESEDSIILITSTVKQQNARQTDNSTLAIKAENLNESEDSVILITDSPPVFTGNSTAINVKAEKVDEIDLVSESQPPCTPSKSKHLVTPSGSPAAKIHTTGPRKSTGKKSATPKRKLPSRFWTKQAVDALVAECVLRKKEVQGERVPLRVWQEISQELQKKDFNYNHEDCRSKFMTLNEFFHHTLLPAKGCIGGIMWSHFEGFLDIHDVSKDFLEGLNLSSAPRAEPCGNEIWTPAATLMLLSEYSNRKPSFDSTTSGIKHSLLFHEISVVLQIFDTPVNAKQCMDHMKELKSEFRKEFDRMGRGTGQAPTTFPYYERMLEIFEGSPTLKAPFALSAGRQLKYTIAGDEAQAQQRTSRTRATSSDTAGKKRKNKVPIYKPVDNVKSNSLQDEVRLMRESFEARSQKRLEALLQLVENTKK